MRECWQNPAIKAIMKIFVILMVMDIAYRIYVIPKLVENQGETAQASQNQNAQPNYDQKPAADFEGVKMQDDQGNDVKVTKDYNDLYPQDDFMNDPSTNKAPKELKHVHVNYCVGCAYNQQFQELKTELEMLQIAEVTSANYPVPPMKNLLSWVATIAQWAVIMLMMNGDSILPQLGIDATRLPAIYHKMVEKKWMVGIAAWMLGNQLQKALTDTGAFEVSCNDQLIFSKLQTNMMPDVKYIVSLISKF